MLEGIDLDFLKAYGAKCIMFGDRPMASLMIIAVERACESYS